MANAAVLYDNAKKQSGGAPGITVVTIDFLGDDATGAFDVATIPSNILDVLNGQYCIGAVTDPGATAPTADYDLEVATELGADVFGAALNDRSATVTEIAVPTVATPIIGAWTVTTTNQSVAAAIVRLQLYFSPYPFKMA